MPRKNGSGENKKQKKNFANKLKKKNGYSEKMKKNFAKKLKKKIEKNARRKTKNG